MAKRKWIKAMVTYTGGRSYTVKGRCFRLNRPLPIDDKVLAFSLEKIPGMGVTHEYEAVSRQDPGEAPKPNFGDPPDTVSKAKMKLRKKKSKKKVAKE